MAQRSSTTSTTSTVAKVLAIILVVLLVLIVVAEILLRVFLANQVRDGFAQQAQEEGVSVEEEVAVSFGPVPVLFGLASGAISEVSIATPSTLQVEGDAVSGQPATDVTLNGLHLDEAMTTDQFTATTELPEDYLLAVIRGQIAENYPEGAGMLADFLTVTDLTANGDTSTLDVEFVQGAAVLSLTPVQQNGQLTFEAANTQLFGFDLPAEVTEQISRALSEELTNQATARGMGISQFEVLDGAVRATVTGENVPLRGVASTATPSSTQPQPQS